MSLTTTKEQRDRKKALIEEKTFDLLVIGGGVTGAGIALDAASRGIKTVLIEKNDYASGTSSKSTKLIHGGLRYLKNFEFSLVKEVGHEREIVWRNAPHLVHPEKMLLPIVKKGSLSKLGASIGIYLYDYLAGVKAGERRKMLSTKETLAREPLLDPQKVIGGALYTEYRTDDARLTIELIKTAETFGAVCLNYIKADEPVYENGQIKGFTATDEITGGSFTVRARGVINAAGPWVDEIRRTDNSLTGKHLKLSKGVHLVFPFKKLPVNESLYFDVAGDKGRMIFVIPRGRAVYAGTTDTFYDEAENPNVTQDDVSYILNAMNAMFPEAKLSEADVESTWSGVRPLIMEPGKSASELSRKDELFVSESGLVSIAGGKLTGYRKMAERSIDAWLQLHPELTHISRCYTKNIPLVGSQFGDKKVFLENLYATCGQIPHSHAALDELFEKYGADTEKIVAYAYDIYNKDRNCRHPLKKAELLYATQYEQVVKPADFFIRRTGMLYFNRIKVAETRAYLNEYWLETSGLDYGAVQRFQAEFDRSFDDVLQFQ